jgi:hypothetical protein
MLGMLKNFIKPKQMAIDVKYAQQLYIEGSVGFLMLNYSIFLDTQSLCTECGQRRLAKKKKNEGKEFTSIPLKKLLQLKTQFRV